MRHRNRNALAAAATAFALAATACLGPNRAEDPSASVPDPFGSIAVAPGAPIEIGTLLATSGDAATMGTDSLRGVELAVDYLDGKLDGKPGKLLDHDVQLVNVDEGCTADGGAAGARLLANETQLAGVIGTNCSVAALGGAAETLSDRGVLLVSPTNTDPALTAAGTHQPFYVRVAPNAALVGMVAADFAHDKLEALTAVTLHDAVEGSGGGAAAFQARFEARGGTVAGSRAIGGAGVFRDVLQGMGGPRPDVVYYAAPEVAPSCGLLPRAAAGVPGLAATAVVASGGCLDARYLQVGGAPATGTYVAGPDPAVIDTGEFYREEFLPAYQEQWGSSPQPEAVYAFDAASVLFDAIVRAATQREDGSIRVGRTDLRDAIYATKEYFGMTGTITCTPLGDCAAGVKTAIYRVPDVPVPGGDPAANPVYVETTSPADLTP